MAEPDDKGQDKVVPPKDQPASSSDSAAADASWAEVLNAMQSAEEAVSNAVQGVAKIHNKQ
jgi:hypothetical protein